jgi:hypothetical protein
MAAPTSPEKSATEATAEPPSTDVFGRILGWWSHRDLRATQARAVRASDRVEARDQQVREIERMRDAHVAKLNHEIEQLRVRAQQDIDGAHARVESASLDRERSIASELYAELVPAARAFSRGQNDAGAIVPVPTAADVIAAIWRRADERAKSEIGEHATLDERHLGFALLASEGDAAVARAGARGWWESQAALAAVHAASVAMLENRPLPVVVDLLQRGHLEVLRNLQVMPYPPNADRAAAHRRYATRARTLSALEAFDKEADAKEEARRHEASLVHVAQRERDKERRHAERFGQWQRVG